MKKIFFAFVALVALALTSCEPKGVNIMDIDASKLDNTTESCWEYTQTNMYGVSITAYMWASEQQLVLMLQAAAQLPMEQGIKVTTSYKKSNAADYDSCMDKLVGAL